MKRTKWANKTDWTQEEKQARAKWRAADKRFNGIREGLQMPVLGDSREDCHTRLDQLLDRIAKQRAEAVVLFPEVGESFTIAEGTL